MNKSRLRKYRLIFKLITTLVGIVLLSIIGIYTISFILGPPPLMNEENTIYYNNSNEVIGEERSAENRYWVDLNDMSPHIINATLIVEDQHFKEHNGFDYKRIIGAIFRNVTSGTLKEGASTLTQQLARNLYLSHEKTWDRKIKEAFYTVRLEMYYSKGEILEGYLNSIYYGHGSYGIEAASNYFFDKSSKDLDVAEAAMLAGIPKGPTYYSPLNDKENAEQRQEQILQLMLTNNMISPDEYQNAKTTTLAYSKTKKEDNDSIGPYFQDAVLKEAAKILELDTEEIRSGGFEIYTTLDSEMQIGLEDSVSKTIDQASEMQIGALAMDPKTGAIKAMVGGRDYSESPFNRAVNARRMAGSTFKPFLYYAALENGYTASTMLMSKPTAFELEDGEVYRPSNFNDYYAYEPISLAQALALSDNIYAVKTNLYLTPKKLVNTARRFGLSGELPEVPSLALGSASVSLEEMVTGYGMIANGGHEINSYTIEKIINRDGKTIYEKDNKLGDLVLDPKQTFILADLMTGVFDRQLDGYASVTGAPIANQLSRVYAGKSGSTKSDSWMIGFSPQLVAGVWGGYDDNRVMEVVAESGYPKKVWASFMEKAHEGLPEKSFEAPNGVVGVAIDPQTGNLATPYCEVSRVMYFEKGSEPKQYCTDHFPHDMKPKEENSNDGPFKRIFDSLFGT
ncbi:PBP1A family penicillin-binding protein [Bacilli bacterium]|nr:penicillin-binding protein [Bacilli bacterium VT-13-104]PZD87291.1 PBP1A family penicillin-binding protein [Bacilli bacterium]PZD88765.1 PBP1A family penicillin-binding protein [Bacilli bacterium]PZD91619.1 PBP1A family penicillin-binding protein [Bacilli bacterium]RCO06755.1 PBP1A family penicillin-binding protein [Bacilli bacterium]